MRLSGHNSRLNPMYMLSSGLVGNGLRLQIPDLWQASSEVDASTEVPVTDAGETSGMCNLRPVLKTRYTITHNF